MPPTRTSAAASSSSSASSGKSASRPQPSRKGKAAWRRNIDLSEVDSHLESKRTAERLGLIDSGAASSSSSSSSAAPFELDTKGDEALGNRLRQKRTKRPLKSLQVLENESAVPAFNGKRSSSSSSSSATSSRKGTGKMSKSEKERLTRLAKRDIKGAFGVVVEPEVQQGQRAMQSVKGTVMRTPEEDAWQRAVQSVEGAAAGATSTSSSTKRSVLPSLSKPTTAQSYNPTAKSHEELLQRAYEAEMKRYAEEQANREYKEKWNAGGAAAAEDSEGAEGAKRWAGMLIDDAEAAQEDEDEEEEEASTSRTNTAAPPQRKTRTQRLKDQRRQEAERQLALKRAQKMQRGIVSQLPSMAKSLKKQEAQRLATREARKATELDRMAAEGLAGRRSGKHLVPQSMAQRDALRVALDEDLTESLRALKAEGADAGGAFRERWDRMVLRGLVEPRVPKGAGRDKGRRRKGREYETHAYKRFE
ncbi:P60-like protein [Jaminaea rosea]|uniref:Ribosome biogenesis protein NOP53 n=1 Tax=Jaminaea rosea TaxID=1569628 RepID=A0A316UMY5_9BASI|nr:P60-like protein [Jaminaea rosea]PWN25283.1 P60-like protein [Jaminaea rosea]